MIVTLTQNLIVDVCVTQFTNTIDELKDNVLVDHDDWGLWMFRRIFTFFEPNLKT